MARFQITLKYLSFAILGFFGGAAISFNIFRSFNLFNLLRRGAYHIQTIFYNTFYELFFGVIIGGAIGIGLSVFLCKKKVKFFHLAVGLSLGIFLTALLSETLDRQLRPPLVRAAQHKKLARIQAAIQRGSDLNVRDIKGNTALMEASINSNFPMAKALIEAGADVNVVNDFNYTALMYAATPSRFNVDNNSKINIIKALIDASADPNLTTTAGDTVLMQVLRRFGLKDMEIVKVLIQAGADVNVVNEEGETALELAERTNLTALVRLLREAGAKYQSEPDV